jgi:hypothetical protein
MDSHIVAVYCLCADMLKALPIATIHNATSPMLKS